MIDSRDPQAVTAAVNDWLQTIVIGLGLCPFASKPARENTIFTQVVYPENEEALLEELQALLTKMDDTDAAELETALLVIPELLADFFDYHQFLNWAQAMLKRTGWVGVYQLASFHPNYVFAGSDDDDVENFTNRAPFPIIHVIREASLEQALEYFPDIDEVPARNQATMANLSQAQLQQLFHYLFAD